MSLIVNPAVAALNVRPVNSGVRLLGLSNLLVLKATSQLNFSREI
jgi:hypothetical protein